MNTRDQKVDVSQVWSLVDTLLLSYPHLHKDKRYVRKSTSFNCYKCQRERKMKRTKCMNC